MQDDEDDLELHDHLSELEQREIERAELLLVLKQTIMDVEDDLGGQKTVAAGIMLITMFELLPQGRIPVFCGELRAPNFVTQHHFLRTEIFPRIRSFTPNVIERNLILCDLLEWALHTFIQDFRSEFLAMTQMKRQEFLTEIAKAQDSQ